MSDEAVEFSIGGNNKGFVAVLNDTEKKAKESGTRAAKEFDKVGERGLKNKGKIVSDLDGIAGEFGRVTTVSGALEAVLSRIGGGLKMAGVAAAVGGIAKGIYDATMSAREYELAIDRINSKSRGGTSNYSLSDLGGNLASIQEERKKNFDSVKDPLSAAGSTVSDYLANAGDVLMGGEGKSYEEINNTRADRENELRKKEEEALDRIAKKQKEIFEIEQERIKGNKEGADLLTVEARYYERIQDAIDSRNIAEQKRLQGERDQVTAAIKRQQEVALAQRVTLTATAAGRSGNAGRAVGLSTEEEQRQSNNQRIIEAGMNAADAQKASDAMPGNKDLAAQAQVAAREVDQIAAENAKWERDIARSKAEQLKTIEAELAATRLTMQGKTIEAGLVTKIAANEIAAQKAIYAGNTALAQRITQQGQLLITQEKYNRLIDASTGKLRPAADRSNDIRERRLLQRNTARSQRRLESTGGLTRVQRDSSGRIISGIDPDTGQRVSPKPGTGGPTNNIGSSTGGGTNFEEELRQRGSAGSGTSFADELRQRKGTASDEMGAKQASAQAAAQTQNNLNEAAKAQSSPSGADTVAGDIREIRSVVTSWK